MSFDALLQLAGQALRPVQPDRRQQLGWLRRWAASRRQSRRCERNLAQAALGEQVIFLNQNRARRPDETIHLNGQRPSIPGAGKWKQMDASQVLRSVFSCPAGTMKSTAEAAGCSNRHMTDLLYMCAHMLHQRQLQAVGHMLSTEEARRWFVLQVMFDESQFRVTPADHEGRATEAVSVMGAHGHVVWSFGVHHNQDQVCEDELVLNPLALTEASAACMWAALERLLPQELWRLVSGHSRHWMASINLGADHAKANVKLARAIEFQAPDNVICLHGFCKQHASGLCIAGAVKYFDVLCPAFCVAKLFRRDVFYRRFRLAVCEVVKANIRRAGPDWQPAARDLARSRAILELAFYHRDLRTCTNEEEAEKHRCLDRRRQYGAALIEACPGDWTKRPIVHRCKGCSCTTDEEAAQQVCSRLFTVTFNVLSVPSMNKWLSVWPLLCDLVLTGSFHRVFVDATRLTLGETLEEDMVEDSVSETELLGASQDWHRQERRRAAKVLRWVEAKGTHSKSMMFVHLVSPILKLHYTLFKYAQTSPLGHRKSYLFNLCDARVSVCARILGELSDLLFNSAETGPWAPMVYSLGPLSAWPREFKEAARVGICLLLGQVWRRLVHVYDQWPWRLVAIGDPDVPDVQKIAVAEQLFAAPLETLDPGCSLKVRRRAGAKEALLTPEWQRFLFHSFNKVVLSTAFVETLFARFNQWLQRSRKPLSMSLLQGKHMTSGFVRACAEKRGAALGGPEPSAKRCKLGRPAWVFKAGERGRVTGRHVAVAEHITERAVGVPQVEAFQQAVAKWRELSPRAKTRAQAVAREKNARIRLMKKRQHQLDQRRPE